jgi:hypothetical protein
VALRALALPSEHGGWGLLVEPIALGLLLAPSAPGACLGLAASAAFLARHPLKLVAGDRRRGTRHARTALAERVALGYLLVAAAALAGALALAAAALWVPLALAAPLAAVQLFSDARGRSRDVAAELAGSVALASSVAVIGLAGGLPMRIALALWLVLAARAVSSVLYVRARIRLDRGIDAGLRSVYASHLAGLAIAGALVLLGDAPWLAVLALAVLSGRAVLGVSKLRRPLRPRMLGLQELGYGVLTVLLLALGYALGV